MVEEQQAEVAARREKEAGDSAAKARDGSLEDGTQVDQDLIQECEDE